MKESTDVVSAEVCVSAHAGGLHSRVGQACFRAICHLDAVVDVSYDGRRARGGPGLWRKFPVYGAMALGVGQGESVVISGTGDDASLAVEAVRLVLEEGASANPLATEAGREELERVLRDRRGEGGR